MELLRLQCLLIYQNQFLQMPSFFPVCLITGSGISVIRQNTAGMEQNDIIKEPNAQIAPLMSDVRATWK